MDQSRRSVGPIPSYARPTEAAKNRQGLQTPKKAEQKPTAPRTPKRSPWLLNPASGRKSAHRYSLTTHSSRSKARWPGHFRFFDLPAELRDLIYEHAGIGTAPTKAHVVDVSRIQSKNANHRLPPILRANRQIRDEAGALYFNSGSFKFINYNLKLDQLIAYLKIIGQSNRERLANNSKVSIGFSVSWTTLSLQEQGRIREGHGNHYTFRNLSLSDAAYLVDLGPLYERLAERFPGLRRWSLFSQIRGLGHRYQNEGMYASSPWSYSTPIPMSFVDDLRPALKRLLGAFGERLDLDAD